ncbi:MAG: TolC family protein [Prevotellaceae bacterium]|jgi:outer membrane protein TolC|nr:TolC family protein [Prevotellaceae bacterium]
MKKFLIIIAVTASSSIFAQNSIDNALISVERNNTALKAIREDIEAQKIENKTGIYLPNPELEFNYLWGSPGNIGNRNDINISQTFDFPTVAGMKRKISDKRNNLLELRYRAEKLDILLQARQYCIDLIRCNAMKQELEQRLKHAAALAEGYKKRLDSGDANILEYNKAQLNLAMAKGEAANMETERKSVAAELKRLNGGLDITVNDTEYGNVILPDNFDEWFARAEQSNPVLEYVKQEVEIAKSEISLNKAMLLPNISAGFMREKVVGETYQGISVSLSIPLWANKNKVKQAKAALKADEAKQADSRLQFYEYLKSMYNKSKDLQLIAEEYRQTLLSLNSAVLLTKALDAGEISLLDYIVELGLYYNTVDLKLNAEREFQKAFAELLKTAGN